MVALTLQYGGNFSAGIESLDSVSRVQTLTPVYLCGLEHSCFFLICEVEMVTAATLWGY